MNVPRDVAYDAAGDLYIADDFQCRVRKVSGGIITTVAGGGGGGCGYSGDGGPATSAQLRGATGITVTAAGDLYIADIASCVIRVVSAGIINTAAGNGTCAFGGDGGPATAALVRATDVFAVGNDIYVSDTANCRVRLISGGNIDTVPGGVVCTNAARPQELFVKPGGDIYFAEPFFGCRVRTIIGGVQSVVAGTGACSVGGGGGPALNAGFVGADSVAADSAGAVYVDAGCRIYKVDAGIATHVAGAAFPDSASCIHLGEGGPAVDAGLHNISDVEVSSSGDLYIAEFGGTGQCIISKVSGGVLTRAAGTPGSCTYNGDGIAATSAGIEFPTGIATDPAGNLYIAANDPSFPASPKCRIRKVDTLGVISTVLGTGPCASSPDGATAATSTMTSASDIAFYGGELYFTEGFNACRVRKITGAGTIVTVVGLGYCAPSWPPNGPALARPLKGPGAIAFDAAGNLYIGDSCFVLRVNTAGITSRIGGNGQCITTGDGGPAMAAAINTPGIAVDGAGNLYIPNGSTRVRVISARP